MLFNFFSGGSQDGRGHTLWMHSVVSEALACKSEVGRTVNHVLVHN